MQSPSWAIGIGASTAIFSVVDAVVLRGLPFDEHDRLAAVLEHDTQRPTTFGGGTTTPQTLLDWRAMQQPFEMIAGSASTRFELRNDRGEPEDGRGLRVTHEFFPTLRVRPLHGRLFTVDDEAEGAHRVMVLSHAFWQRRFGETSDAVGSTFPVGTASYEIVGVLPPGFDYPVASERPTEMFVPAMFPKDDRVRGGISASLTPKAVRRSPSSTRRTRTSPVAPMRGFTVTSTVVPLGMPVVSSVSVVAPGAGTTTSIPL